MVSLLLASFRVCGTRAMFFVLFSSVSVVAFHDDTYYGFIDKVRDMSYDWSIEEKVAVCDCIFPFTFKNKVYDECFYYDKDKNGEFKPMCCSKGSECKMQRQLKECKPTCPRPLPPSVKKKENSNWITAGVKTCADKSPPWLYKVDIAPTYYIIQNWYLHWAENDGVPNIYYLTCESMKNYCNEILVPPREDKGIYKSHEDYMRLNLKYFYHIEDTPYDKRGLSPLDGCCTCGGGITFERTIRTFRCTYNETKVIKDLYENTGGSLFWANSQGHSNGKLDPCSENWFGIECEYDYQRETATIVRIDLKDNNLLFPGMSIFSIILNDLEANLLMLRHVDLGFVSWTSNEYKLTLQWPFGHPSVEDEKKELIRLFDATGGVETWTNRNGWSDASSDPCLDSWYGCECDHETGHIKVLDLADNNLANLLDLKTQSIVELMISKLTKLKAIDLSGNWGVKHSKNKKKVVWGLVYTETPQKQALLKFRDALGGLTLTWDNTTDPCVASWEGVTCDNNGNVKGVILPKGSMLKGSLPDMSPFTKLEALDLSGNPNLNGTISVGLSLNFLKTLILSNTGIGGGFPESWLSETSATVETIDISNARLRFDASNIKYFSKLKRLRLLNLAGNEIYGDLSFISSGADLGFNALKSLNLANNKISKLGGSSKDFNQFSMLSNLNLENNHLVSLPFENEFLMFSSLAEFSIRGNYGLNGSHIPSGIKYMSNLKFLDVSSCGFTGGFPRLWAGFTPSTVADVSRKYIESTWFNASEKQMFPSLVLPQVEIINASNNSLNGDIGKDIVKPLVLLQSLKVLDVSMNQIKGQVSTKDITVVDQTWRQQKAFQNLEKLLVAHNRIESFGLIFERRDIMQTLVELDVSYNLLSGSIPAHFETLLRKAYFHGNFRMSASRPSNHLDTPVFLKANDLFWEAHNGNYFCKTLERENWKVDPWYDSYERCRCKAGFQEEVNGSCTLCDVDSYMDIGYSERTNAQKNCITCPINSGTNGTKGSASIDDCICSKGYERAPLGTNSKRHCRACPVGKYKSDSEKECTACPNGKYQSKEGQTYCHDCSPGYYCKLGTEEACPEGTFGDTTNLESSMCSGKCDWKDFKMSGRNAIICSCMETFVFDTNSSACLCDKGFYRDEQKCVPCPDGTTKDVLGNNIELCQDSNKQSLIISLVSIVLITIIASLLYLRQKNKMNIKVAEKESQIRQISRDKNKAQMSLKKQQNKYAKAMKHNYVLKASVAELNSVNTAFQGFDKERGIIHIPLEELTFLTKLGAGAFGTVVKAKWKEKTTAVKLLDRAKLTRSNLEKIKNEIRILGQVKHSNIVNFVGASWDKPPKLCIVLEFVEGGDLRQHLITPNKKPGMTPELGKIALGVSKALAHIHYGIDPQTCLIHRDVKPENVLLTKDLVAKLADLGEARFQNKCDADDAKTMTQVGTPYYLAPEIILATAYTEKVDIYSFGIMLNEIDSKCTPYASSIEKRFQEPLVCRPKSPLRPSVRWKEANVVEKAFIKLAAQCWSANPRDRPTSTAVVKCIERYLSYFNVEEEARLSVLQDEINVSPENSSKNPKDFNSYVEDLPLLLVDAEMLKHLHCKEIEEQTKMKNEHLKANEIRIQGLVAEIARLKLGSKQ